MTSLLSSISTYGSNPYVTTSLSNPFLLMPDNETSTKAITEGTGLKYYIPKIDDLLEVIASGKLHIFRGMITSGIFDLHKVSLKGESLIASLEKKGNQKGPFIKILVESGVDLISLAPKEFWEGGLKTKDKKIIPLSLEKSSEARRVEKAIILSLKHLKANNTSSNRRRIFRQITKYAPHIDLQRILNAAMSCPDLSLLVKGLIKKGGNPNSCRNALSFISEISWREDTLPSFVSGMTPARFPLSSLDVEEALMPDCVTSVKLDAASLHGFQEHFFRSQLFSLFGLSDFWAGTLDPLPRPQANVSTTDLHHFFERIQSVVGYPSPPIFLSEHNSPICKKDWDVITRDSSRPIVIAAGWTNHATVAVIVGDKLYKGNRYTFSKELSPGIYCSTIDRSKLTPELCDEIVANTNHLWFDYDLDLKLGGKPAELHSELKSQTHLNCTWASCAELSFYILQRHAGKTHRQAWLLVKQMKAKVRHSFLLSYLRHDRTHEPHLHSAPLLGAILAKCLFRERSDFPEYAINIKAILDSGLSVDMLQLIYSINSKGKFGYHSDHAITSLAERMGIRADEVFERLDPFYRKEESAYRAMLKAQDNRPLNLSSFYDHFDVLEILNDPLIPESYKVRIASELIPPLCALILLEKEESRSLPDSIRSALSDVRAKVGLSDTEDFLRVYQELIESIKSEKLQLKDIDYSDDQAITHFVRAVISMENTLSSNLISDKVKIQHKYLQELIGVFLRDRHAGFIAAADFLDQNPLPARLKAICDAEDRFPDGPLLRNKPALLKYLHTLIQFPGWDIDSKKRVITQWIRDEPFQTQASHFKEFFWIIEKIKSDESLLLLDAIIKGVWEENPFVVHELFSSLLESSKKYKEALALSQSFGKIAEFLWDNDADFMKSKLKEDIENVALWSKEMRKALRSDYPFKIENPYNAPEVSLDWRRVKLIFSNKEDLVAYLTSKRMFPYDKRRRIYKE